MFERRIFSRGYRLVDKHRFYFSMLIAVLVFIGLSCVIAGICYKAAHASNEADMPASTKQASGRTPTKQPVSGISEMTVDRNALAPASQNDWRLRLVNSTHPLPEGFTVETKALPNSLQFDARAYDDLMEMMRDGKEAGLSFVICSAYRTVAKQKELFDEQVAVEQNNGLTYVQAVETTKTKVAWPGSSEHNLGLAVDIVALGYQKLDEGYLETPECKWLQENSYKYGFIMRYPQDKSNITKIIFEPWHYRYVGADAAAEIKEQGVCLEEYLGMAD